MSSVAKSSSSSLDEATKFHIRPAEPGDSDVNFILDSFDSTLSFLNSIGSSAQWGTKPLSQRPDMVQFITESVNSSNDEKTALNAYIIEKRSGDDGGDGIACGASIMDSSVYPDYIVENKEVMKTLLSEMPTDFLYFKVLVTHMGPARRSKGAGEALIEHVKLEAKRRHHKTILVDCWSGNEGRIMRYYGRHGFRPYLEFTKMGKHVEGVLWHGMILRLDL